MYLVNLVEFCCFFVIILASLFLSCLHLTKNAKNFHKNLALTAMKTNQKS